MDPLLFFGPFLVLPPVGEAPDVPLTSLSPVIDATIPCFSRGEAHLEGYIADGTEITARDRLTVTYHDCLAAAVSDRPTSGRVSSVIDLVYGTPKTLIFLDDGAALPPEPSGSQVRSRLDDVYLPLISFPDQPLRTAHRDGDVTHHVATDGGVVREEWARGDRVRSSIFGVDNPLLDGYAVVSDFHVRHRLDYANPDLPAFILEGEGRLETSRLNGAVSYKVALSGLIAQGQPVFPEQGRVLIVGGHGTLVVVTVQDSTYLRLETYAGDGQLGSVEDVPWRDLLPNGISIGGSFLSSVSFDMFIVIVDWLY